MKTLQESLRNIEGKLKNILGNYNLEYSTNGVSSYGTQLFVEKLNIVRGNAWNVSDIVSVYESDHDEVIVNISKIKSTHKIIKDLQKLLKSYNAEMSIGIDGVFIRSLNDEEIIYKKEMESFVDDDDFEKIEFNFLGYIY